MKSEKEGWIAKGATNCVGASRKGNSVMDCRRWKREKIEQEVYK